MAAHPFPAAEAGTHLNQEEVEPRFQIKEVASLAAGLAFDHPWEGVVGVNQLSASSPLTLRNQEDY